MLEINHFSRRNKWIGSNLLRAILDNHEFCVPIIIYLLYRVMTRGSITLVIIYDMCKAVSHAMIIRGVKLFEKNGDK